MTFVIWGSGLQYWGISFCKTGDFGFAELGISVLQNCPFLLCNKQCLKVIETMLFYEWL